MSEPTMAELSEAFAPCTPSGLADEWWRLNIEIADIRKQRDLIEEIVLNHCMRTGEVVVGETVTVEAYEYLADTNNGKPVWKWKLQVRRERTNQRTLRVGEQGTGEQ